MTHTHCFKPTNPFYPALDRCEQCGVVRYELMGPFARRRARLAGYERMGAAFDSR